MNESQQPPETQNWSVQGAGLQFADAARITAGMLWQDRSLLIPALLLLTGPSLLKPWLYEHWLSAGVYCDICSRIIALVFTLLLCRHWISRLRIEKNIQARLLPSLALTVGIGMSFWFLLFAIVVVQLLDLPATLKSFAIVLVAPAVFVGLRYYYYFLPIAAGLLKPVSILRCAAALTQADIWLPLKIMAAPAGLALLWFALWLSPMPDGRSLALSVISEFSAAVFWILSSYLALGAALLRLSEQSWRQLGFDPYRQSRLTTLNLQANRFVIPLLQPGNGFGMLGLGVLILAANMMRAAVLQPSPEIVLGSTSATGNTVSLTLEIQDPGYKLHGFMPLWFSLAGETGQTISSMPLRAILRSDRSNVIQKLPSTDARLTVDLDFTASRSGKSLTELKDLYLWYRKHKLMRIDLNQTSP